MPVSVQADTQFYFLRHVEVHMDDPDKPLTDEGKQRARVLAEHMKGKKITHIYATHFDRNLDTVVHLAKDQGLEVIRVPKPGSIVDGDEVTNRSKGKIATEPMINALNEVPDGSAVVVSANSGNLFKIMAGVGVESGSDDMPCESKRCFPRDEFHNIWLVTKTGDGITLQKSQY
jgi:hypothetical protein